MERVTAYIPEDEDGKLNLDFCSSTFTEANALVHGQRKVWRVEITLIEIEQMDDFGRILLGQT